MRKMLLAGCLAAASTLSVSADENVAGLPSIIENNVAADLISMYDGVNLNVGLFFGSDKVEYNKDAKVGQISQWAVYNRRLKHDGSASFATLKGDWANNSNSDNYNTYIKKIVKAINFDKLTIGAVEAVGDDGQAKGGLNLIDADAVVAPLGSYVGTKKISSAKSKYVAGGFFGAAYRKILDDSNKVIAGLSFDLVLKGKGKNNRSLGIKGTNADSKTLFKVQWDKTTNANGVEETTRVDRTEMLALYEKYSLNKGADSHFETLNAGSTGKIDDFYKLSYNDLFRVTAIFNDDGKAVKANLGIAKVDMNNVSYNPVDIAVSGQNDSASHKIEHSAFLPMVNASLGKVFNIANREMLVEGTVGAALVKAKSKLVSQSMCTETKISKVVPTIGFNVSMMVTNSIGGGFKANYVFNAKKNNVKVKSNWNAMVYVTIQPKSLNIW